MTIYCLYFVLIRYTAVFTYFIINAVLFSRRFVLKVTSGSDTDNTFRKSLKMYLIRKINYLINCKLYITGKHIFHETNINVIFTNVRAKQ